MSLQFVCIEVRRNLRCANVFLRFDQCLSAVDDLKINVEKDAIRIFKNAIELRIPLHGLFTVETSTMTNLVVDECNASFRLVVANIMQNWFDDDWAKHERQLLDIKPRINVDSDTILYCSNCDSNLTGVRKYQRVLELPSSGIDGGDFFCHHQPNFKDNLMPKANDIFYGFRFLVLNLDGDDHLLAQLKQKESHLYCHRCLQLVGQTLFSGKSAKLWTDTLRLLPGTHGVNDQQKNAALINKPTHQVSYQLLSKIMNESFVCHNNMRTMDPLLQCMEFSKLIVEANTSNRRKQYLLLHLLERDLPMLRNEQPLDPITSCSDTQSHHVVNLKSTKGIKLLYRYAHSDSDDSKLTNLLANWLKISTNTTQISHELFTIVLRDLESNALLLPGTYRYTDPNDFVLTYIFY